MLKTVVIAAAMLCGTAFQARATALTYDLLDTPHGKYLDGGFYRFTGETGATRFQTYSLEQNGADLKLRYDEASGTAQVYGTGYNLITNELAEFNLFYDDVTRAGDRVNLNDMDVVGAVGGVTVRGKGFGLTLLGDSLTGDGWLTNTAGRHFGDFHLAGTRVDNGGCTLDGCGGGSIPAPAPLGLIGAMALLGIWRRRRSS